MTEIRVRLLYFALLRERIGRAEEPLALPAGATVADLVERLAGVHPVVAGLRRTLQVAVNHAMVPPDTALADGDEVALIPPVSGGSDAAEPRSPLCRLSNEPLSWQEVVDAVSGPTQGGLVVFCGVVRDHNQGKQVVRLDYEAYDAMAARTMAHIAERIEAEHPGVRLAMVHRVGTLQIGEPAVLVAASAPHRAAAFTACRAAIDQLKRDVPIWKKEFSPDGEEWLAGPGS